MNDYKPLIIVGAFWFAIFVFMIAGFSGGFGVNLITGYAVDESGQATNVGLLGMMVLVLFFTNIITLFFLIRSHLKK